MNADMNVKQALGVAMVRRVQRLAGIRDELVEMGWESFISAHDLALLEDAGMMLNFETGRVIDTLTAVDGEAVPA